MELANKLEDLLNCTIRFSAPEGQYEGVLKEVFPAAQFIIVGKLILLPDRRMGSLNFTFSELSNLEVISRPDRPKEIIAVKKEVLPVYPKTNIEKLFDLDGSSDIEDEDDPMEYEMKLVPHLSKCVPSDFEIIESFNDDFNSAIKHIRKQDVIGVSLEGINLSRSGTLTWLCISTPCCNFLFDILALGKKAFEKGLKSILECAKLQKIFHDCRLASDCLYHKYGVRLVNVFDTQVADFIVMMQMVKNDKINSRVNTLDACLLYYLEVPVDYLYGDANLDEEKNSLHFHALRPLQHEIQDVLIKNVMYLHLLKRELELALQTPLRRATDVYLNSIQKLHEKELLLVPHKPDELPVDIHLEGIQIFRYQDFEYLCNTVASGPPYREIKNPIKTYLNYRAEYKDGQRKDEESVVNLQKIQIAPETSSDLNSKKSVSDWKDDKFVSCLKRVDSNSDMSTESDRELSDDSEKSQGENSSHKTTKKYEASQFQKPATVKNSIRNGLQELLSRHANGNLKTLKSSVNASTPTSRSSSEVSVKSIHSVNESMLRDSSGTKKLPNFKPACNLPCNSSIVKSETSQIRQSASKMGKSKSELLELISKMRSVNSSTALDSSDDSSTDSKKSASKFECANDSSNAELVKINNSAMEKHEVISDSDLEQMTARVKARRAHLHKQETGHSTSEWASMHDPSNRPAKVKSIKEASDTSSGNQEPTSEDVTIYYSDTLNNKSQFVVKLNHIKSDRLVDLYKKAGDKDVTWTEEGAKTDPCSKYANTDDFWASIRGDQPCNAIDEKLKARLIPAGMAGY